MNTKLKTKSIAKEEPQVNEKPQVNEEPNNSTKTEVKRIIKSKTIWVNIIAFVAFLLQTKYGFVMSEDLQMQILTIINIILRFVTKDPIAWGGTSDGNSN